MCGFRECMVIRVGWILMCLMFNLFNLYSEVKVYENMYFIFLWLIKFNLNFIVKKWIYILYIGCICIYILVLRIK